ncbi:hypothetical protein OGAPHI_001827 [Ogataea philodendri]|uniref:Uncharacterized protein n=1 Tax=Ogataea philodendri TaxID=1378263 RepID=A0A9P8T6G8_9ASCO|nr:uncharacterized protein OGAPHI_001827 [Ogataea philodendri]KAH3668073.1 hypothetical protein OGAPHI_001827 [Ogataea philodendri]
MSSLEGIGGPAVPVRGPNGASPGGKATGTGPGCACCAGCAGCAGWVGCVGRCSKESSLVSSLVWATWPGPKKLENLEDPDEPAMAMASSLSAGWTAA